MSYTRFFDMSSGGKEKEAWTIITVNLPEDEAVKWFEDQFGHHPYNITCYCCGEDYAVSQYATLEQASTNKYNFSYKHFEV